MSMRSYVPRSRENFPIRNERVLNAINALQDDMNSIGEYVRDITVDYSEVKQEDYGTYARYTRRITLTITVVIDQ